jgi:O-antigen/teichoic acid export membrane protein
VSRALRSAARSLVRAASRPALLLMLGRTLGSAAAFAIPVVLARVFDRATFGTYKQLFLIYATLYGIAQFGMAESLFYFVPLEPRRAGRCALNAALVLAGAGGVSIALLACLGSRLGLWLSNDALPGYLPWVGVFLALMLVSVVLEIVMTSRKRYGAAAVTYAVSDILRAALFLIPVLILRSLVGLFLGALVLGVVRCLATFVYLNTEFGGALRPDRAVLLRQASYAVPFGAAALLNVVESSLHQYAVSHFFDAATFAIYSVGCLQIPLLELVAGSSCQVMMVRMAEDRGEGREEAVSLAWRSTTRHLAAVFFPLVGFLLVGARDLVVTLFTERYAASVPIFLIWSATIALAAFQVDGVLRVYAETRFLFGLYLTKLALIAALVVPFIRAFGPTGAVLVTVLAMLAAKTACLARVARLTRTGLRRVLPWGNLIRVAAAAAAACLPALLVRQELQGTAPVRLAAVFAAYACVYAGLYRLLEGGPAADPGGLPEPRAGTAGRAGGLRGGLLPGRYEDTPC